MKTDYIITTLPSGTHHFHASQLEGWINLGGIFEVHLASITHILNPLEIIMLPAFIEITIVCEHTVQIGKFIISDISMNNTAFCKLSGPNSMMLRQLFYMGLELQNMGIPYKENVNAAMSQLFIAMLNSSNQMNDSDSINPAVLKVIDEINLCYTNPNYSPLPSINNSGYSANHFRKLFKEATTLSPIEFLNVHRIDLAKNLIITYNGSITLQELASQCGFSDPYYFRRVFIKQVHMTPSEYFQSYTSVKEEAVKNQDC